MSVCREGTIAKFGFDPELKKPTSKQKVVWIFPCCGTRQVRLYGTTGPRCYACFNRDRRDGVGKEPALQPIRTEKRMLHGQLVEVKIYQLGAPVDYTPSYME
jgi:hypothetical protein